MLCLQYGDRFIAGTHSKDIFGKILQYGSGMLEQFGLIFNIENVEAIEYLKISFMHRFLSFCVLLVSLW